MCRSIAALILAVALSAPAERACAASFSLTSVAFLDGGTLPAASAYSGRGCGGGNIAPGLRWTGAPAGTRSFVLTVWDPDAHEAGGWWHWVRYDIPAGAHGLPPETGRDGRNSFGTLGWGGPCPPAGDRAHHYRFVLRALDIPAVALATPATTGPELEALVRGHVLATATVVGRYARRR